MRKESVIIGLKGFESTRASLQYQLSITEYSLGRKPLNLSITIRIHTIYRMSEVCLTVITMRDVGKDLEKLQYQFMQCRVYPAVPGL